MRMAMFGQADTMGMVNLDWVTSTMSHQQKFKTFPKYAVFLQDITTLCCWMRTAKSGHADKTNTVNLEGQQKKIRMQILGKLNHLFDSNQFQQETTIQCFWMLKAEFGDADTTVMHHWLFPTPTMQTKQFQQETTIQCFWMLKAEFGDLGPTVMHHWLFPTPTMSTVLRCGQKKRK